MRARLALQVSGQAVELREVVLRDKPVAMLEVSPKGSVPVLVLCDGTVIDESYDILLWALGKHDPDCWLPEDRKDLDALVQRNDSEFKKNLDGYKYPERHPGKAREDYRALGEVYLKHLDSRLESSDYLAGGKPGAADIAVMPFVRQFAHVDAEWFSLSPYGSLRNWLTGWIESELFASVMDKYTQWHPDAPSVRFPA